MQYLKNHFCGKGCGQVGDRISVITQAIKDKMHSIYFLSHLPAERNNFLSYFFHDWIYFFISQGSIV